MFICDIEQTRRLLPYKELTDSIREILFLKKAGKTVSPIRMVVPISNSKNDLLLIMPASDGKTAIIKLVTVHPENARMNLPTIQAEIIIIDPTNGNRLGILEGTVLTSRRTAAVSLLAAQYLAPNTNSPLFIIGAGVQGRAHLEAFCEGL